jgi:ribA/ribD-fused uncharacterized protein
MTPECIIEFKNDYSFLSNFYPAYVLFEGLVYPTVEHAYVASKSFDNEFRIKIAELPEYQAGYAKKLGRNITLRPNWEKVKISIMRDLLLQKFKIAPFKEQLLKTNNAKLIEGNLWHDNFWGSCICNKCENKGQNNLGKLLMDVREELRHGKNLFPLVV